MTTRNIHLKTTPKYFQSIMDGVKTFDVRFNDKDFQIGDVLTLEEFDPIACQYSGRMKDVEVLYILVLEDYFREGGLLNYCRDYVVLAIKLL